MSCKQLFIPCPSLFFFIAKLCEFVNLIMKRGHWKHPFSPSGRAGKDRENEASSLYGNWLCSIICFFWWMRTFLNFSSPFHQRKMCFEYLFDIKVRKRWLSKVHGCPLKCTNVLLKKRNPKWDLYVHAYSWNPANF